MFLKQKLRLYFDGNFPPDVIEHFRSPFWKKRVWVTSAGEQGRRGQSDCSITCIANGIDIPS
jgi:hypothetical protein